MDPWALEPNCTLAIWIHRPGGTFPPTHAPDVTFPAQLLTPRSSWQPGATPSWQLRVVVSINSMTEAQWQSLLPDGLGNVSFATINIAYSIYIINDMSPHSSGPDVGPFTTDSMFLMMSLGGV